MRDDGPAARASLNTPRAIAVNSEGAMLIADFGNNRIRRVSPEGAISTFATFNRVWELAWLADGRVIASDLNEIREYQPDGAAFRVVLRRPHKRMTMGPRDTILIYDSYQILRVPLPGDPEVIAGAAPPADVDPGPAEFVRVLFPRQVRYGGGLMHFLENRGVRRVRFLVEGAQL